MVSVRLSEDEYAALRQLCIVAGARSVSDLTRDAMRMLVNGANRDSGAGSYMADIRAQIGSIEKKLEQLTVEIETSKGSGNC
jgi:ribbon-helix-helix CopG family protein